MAESTTEKRGLRAIWDEMKSVIEEWDEDLHAELQDLFGEAEQHDALQDPAPETDASAASTETAAQ